MKTERGIGVPDHSTLCQTEKMDHKDSLKLLQQNLPIEIFRQNLFRVTPQMLRVDPISLFQTLLFQSPATVPHKIPLLPSYPTENGLFVLLALSRRGCLHCHC